MKNYIELRKQVGEHEGMELWKAFVHYDGHTHEGFALCGPDCCDWYESDPRELNDLTVGLRLSAHVATPSLLGNDEFAEKLGFTDWSELMEMSEEIVAQGDVSWFVTYQPMSGRYIAWDDAELDSIRVQKFDLRHEAEDYQVGGYAETLPNEERFLYVLNALEDRLAISHREGHCEHVGQCVLVPILRGFLESPEGKESLEGFREWYTHESPTELFRTIFGREFVAADWIAEDEIPAFRAAVEAAEMEHAVIFPSIVSA